MFRIHLLIIHFFLFLEFVYSLIDEFVQLASGLLLLAGPLSVALYWLFHYNNIFYLLLCIVLFISLLVNVALIGPMHKLPELLSYQKENINWH